MSSLTHKWLRQNVQPYPNSNRVYADIDAALARFNTLRPKSDVYIFDDGRSQLLLCVHGLLPITFRHASYNIPMAVWITREYPRHPPLVFVVPTNDMLVKPGKYLDVSGRCNIEYTQHWERKHEGCTLSALFEALQDHFSHEPPVYSKPKDDRPASQPSQSDSPYAGRPPPPLPSSGPATSNTLSPSHPSSSPARPALPSKPQDFNSALPLQYHEPHRPISTNIIPSPVFQTQPPPPLPPHPPILNSFGYGSPPRVPSVGPAIQSTQFSRGDPPPPVHTFTPPLQAPVVPRSPPQAPPGPPPVPHLPHSFVIPNYVRNAALEPPRTEPTHPPAPDLLDGDTDSSSFTGQTFSFPAPPPRPPNPELASLQAQVHQKLVSELNSLSQALALDADRLRTYQTDLLTGEPAIKDEMARLEAVRDVCRNVANRTRQAVHQAESNISELRRKGDPEVDELVCVTNIVHNQLINLIADDNAVEDTIYHLHRALNTGRIDLERFLRLTRVLAEEQFMKRALIDKIQMGMSTMSPTTASNWA
ncbi:UEV domain-containing protein [Crassisporium funariophilum]|nr:UEV domain-containing protein [Crassisporium funariophilum]